MKILVTDCLNQTGNEVLIDEQGALDFQDTDLHPASEFVIQGKAIGIKETVLVQCMVKGTILLPCSRCGEEFFWNMDLKLEEMFKLGDQEKNLFDEDISYNIDHQNYIDLTEPIRQLLVVNMPFKPLCKESCPIVECTPEQKKIDPRLEVLSKIRKNT